MAAPGNADRLAETATEARPTVLRLAEHLDRETIAWPGANPPELNGNVLRQTLLDTFSQPSGFPGSAAGFRLQGAAGHRAHPVAGEYAVPEAELDRAGLVEAGQSGGREVDLQGTQIALQLCESAGAEERCRHPGSAARRRAPRVAETFPSPRPA